MTESEYNEALTHFPDYAEEIKKERADNNGVEMWYPLMMNYLNDSPYGKSNVYFLHIANSDKTVKIYSLDVIISVGYCVKSKCGVEFHKWANSVLKQYILQGYAVNNNPINQLSEED